VEIKIPPYVKDIMMVLMQHGYEAYVVGGCVRDSILGREPHDWDVCTNALPQEVQKMFNHTVLLGIKYGTVGVVNNDKCVEVTTYRNDGRYTDNVKYMKTLKSDLARRDFTINAIVADVTGNVRNRKNVGDIKRKLVKCVENADKRFAEDPLRMLRAIRFAADLDFSIEFETWKSIKRNRDSLKKVSIERIRDELSRIILSKNADYGISLFEESWLNEAVEIPKRVPQLNISLNCVENDLVSRWGAYVWQLYYETVYKVILINKFKFSKRMSESVTKIITELNILNSCQIDYISENDIKEMIALFGKEDTSRIIGLLNILHSDSIYKTKVKEIKDTYFRILAEKMPITRKDLAINGNDLIGLGMKGETIGKTLNGLTELIWEHPEWNTRECLFKLVK